MTVLVQLRRQGTENARTDNRDTGVLLVELCQAAPRAQQAATRLRQAAEAGSLTALHDLVDRERR